MCPGIVKLQIPKWSSGKEKKVVEVCAQGGIGEQINTQLDAEKRLLEEGGTSHVTQWVKGKDGEGQRERGLLNINEAKENMVHLERNQRSSTWLKYEI